VFGVLEEIGKRAIEPSLERNSYGGQMYDAKRVEHYERPINEGLGPSGQGKVY